MGTCGQTERKWYVGIDVSKLSLDICIVDVSGKEVACQKVPNSRLGFKRICQKLESLTLGEGDKKACHICLESTGIYSVGVAAYLLKEQYVVSVINPSTSAAFLKTQLRRTKTDKADAHGLALYALKLKPCLYQPAPESVRMLQAETRFLLTLIQKKTSLHREKESLTSAQKNVFDAIIKTLEEKIEAQRCLIRKMIGKNTAQTAAITYLTSIPGIGEQTAWAIISEVLYEPNTGFVLDKKKQVSHAGLSPQEKQSGSSLKSPTRISKTGNRILRQILFLPTLTAIRRCDSIASMYERLLKNGKRKKVAVVACMRKLLCLAITLLQKKTVFLSNYLPSFSLRENSFQRTSNACVTV